VNEEAEGELRDQGVASLEQTHPPLKGRLGGNRSSEEGTDELAPRTGGRVVERSEPEGGPEGLAPRSGPFLAFREMRGERVLTDKRSTKKWLEG